MRGEKCAALHRGVRLHLALGSQSYQRVLHERLRPGPACKKLAGHVAHFRPLGGRNAGYLIYRPGIGRRLWVLAAAFKRPALARGI